MPDAASLPDIVAVHLPRRGVADTSGSALKVQVLDALHYIVERAGPQADVVVNLSYGTMAGPHDGQHDPREAIDELVATARGRLTVVLPAGNSYEARCHAVFQLGVEEEAPDLRWKRAARRRDAELPGNMAARGRGRSLRVKVRDPNGRSSPLPVASNSVAAPAPDVGSRRPTSP